MNRLNLFFSILTLTPIVACSAAPSSESVGQSEQAQISDIQSMTARADGNFDVTCKNGTTEIVTPAQIAANQVCNGGTGGSTNRTIIFGTSDSCDASRVVASITTATDCMTLSDSEAAWSVSVNGQCRDISDTSVRKACLANQPGRILIYGTSDSCDDSRIATSVAPTTDCSTLSDTEASWSIKVDGQCLDISDTSLRKACMSAPVPGRVLIYGTSDSCDASRIAASIGDTTDCSTLSDSDASWSIKVNGVCTDISDTSVRKACMAAPLPGRVLIYGTSDSCDNSRIAATVRSNTDCATLSDTEAAWSVKVDGQCLDISDTSVRKACMVHQP